MPSIILTQVGGIIGYFEPPALWRIVLIQLCPRGTPHPHPSPLTPHPHPSPSPLTQPFNYQHPIFRQSVVHSVLSSGHSFLLVFQYLFLCPVISCYRNDPLSVKLILSFEEFQLTPLKKEGEKRRNVVCGEQGF